MSRNGKQYAVFAFVLAALGWMIQKKEPLKSADTIEVLSNAAKEDDKELDEWFSGEKK